MIKDNYEDIINLPHYEPIYHKRMSKYSRAAQFAPFSALTGYDDAIKEAARLTDKRIDITDELKEELDNKLRIIFENIIDNPNVIVTYFVYDKTKVGGKYVTVSGDVSKIDICKKIIKLNSDIIIPIEEIIEIDGDLFKKIF